ncbi:hypothetical protein VTK26DRAFT_621 [Humicola hyalothermophila]
MARSSPSTVAFDPYAFTEEWLIITQSLLSRPRPLRTPDSNAETHNPCGAETNVINPISNTGSHGDYLSANHQPRPSIPIVPAASPGTGDPLEPALRIAALLFLKRTPAGLATECRRLRRAPEPASRPSARCPPAFPRGQVQEDDHQPTANNNNSSSSHLDNLTRRPQQPQRAEDHPPSPKESPPRTLVPPPHPPGTTPGTGTRTSTTEIPAIKPVILFLCVMAHVASLRGDANEGRLAASEDRCCPRGIFRECLREMAGLYGGDVKRWRELVRSVVFGDQEGECREGGDGAGCEYLSGGAWL